MVHIQKKRFLDREFSGELLDDFYYLSDPSLQADKEITQDNFKLLELSSVMPSMYFSHDILEDTGRQVASSRLDQKPSKNSSFNHPVIQYGTVYDPQVITFLAELVRRKSHLQSLIHFKSSCQERFFLVWVYMSNFGRLQRYPLAVDDRFPITEEGMNLFSSVENSQNIVLAVLEKVWNKYVYMNKISGQLQGRYIDKIILAFLGAPSFRVKIHDVMERNSIEELAVVVLGKEGVKLAYQQQNTEEANLVSENPSKQMLFQSMTNLESQTVAANPKEDLESDYPR